MGLDIRKPIFHKKQAEGHWKKNRLPDRQSGCLSDLLGKPDASSSWKDYRQLAYSTAVQAWLIYTCTYKGKIVRHWFDARLIRVIANAKNQNIDTCYHWHKFRSPGKSDHDTVMSMLDGERKLKLARDTRALTDSELIDVEANNLPSNLCGLFGKKK